jgi:hypothetical protein
MANSWAASLPTVGANNGGNVTLTFSNFVNAAGSAYTLVQDDIVVAAYACSGTSDHAMATSSAGWTLLGEHYSNGTIDTNLAVFAKKMTAAPDASITFTGPTGASNGTIGVAHVIKGADIAALDVAAVLAAGTGTSVPNPGSVTPSTAGAFIAVVGAGAAAAGAAFTNPGDLSATANHFRSGNHAETNDIAIGFGWKEDWASGAFDPAAWGGGNVNASNSWVAITLAIKPVAAAVPLTPDNSAHSHTASSPLVEGTWAADEMFADPGFNVGIAGSGIGWSGANGGWSIDTALSAAVGASAAGYVWDNAASAVDGNRYSWELRVSNYSAGTVRVYAGASAGVGSSISSNGTFSGTLTANGGGEAGLNSPDGFIGRVEYASLRPVPVVIPSNSSHDHSSSSPGISANSSVTVNSALHAHSSTSPSLAAHDPATSVAVNSSVHAHETTQPALVFVPAVAIHSSAHAHSSTQPTLAAKSDVSVNSILHDHSSTQPNLAAKSSVSANSAVHSHAATSPTLAARSSVAIDDAAHALSSTSPVLAAGSAVSVNSSVHAQSASSPTLSAAGAVTVDSVAHAVTSTQPTIAAKSSVSIDGTVHPHTSADPVLAAKSVVAVNDNLIEVTSSSPILSGGAVVVVHNVLHGHTATSAFLGERSFAPAIRQTHSGAIRTSSTLPQRGSGAAAIRTTQSRAA